ncbi:hypothetical protein IWX50DRAFT_667521, partial [Phyllosticta citricarpa]
PIIAPQHHLHPQTVCLWLLFWLFSLQITACALEPYPRCSQQVARTPASTTATQPTRSSVDSNNLATAKNLPLATPSAGRRRHPILLPQVCAHLPRDWLVQAVTLAIGQRLYGSSSLNEDVHSCVDFIDI